MRNKTPGLNWGGGLVEVVCPQEESELGEELPHRALWAWVCTGESGGEGVKAKMTLLA